MTGLPSGQPGTSSRQGSHELWSEPEANRIWWNTDFENRTKGQNKVSTKLYLMTTSPSLASSSPGWSIQSAILGSLNSTLSPSTRNPLRRLWKILVRRDESKATIFLRDVRRVFRKDSLRSRLTLELAVARVLRGMIARLQSSHQKTAPVKKCVNCNQFM